MKINRDMIDQGFISEKKHSLYDYYIYNYTPKAQYDRVWNEDTLNCRGLILDGQGNIIARPFKKFFNLEEYAENSHLGALPSYNNFAAYEKMDGSLGILYKTPDGKLKLATRGSFDSEQACAGTHILLRKHTATLHALSLLAGDYTFLFEIIYPQNRIVINYGDLEDVVLLAVIDKQTGEEWTYEQMESFGKRWNISVVKQYDCKCGLIGLKDIPGNNREGFVVKFDTGLRVKIKYEEYVRLHRILTGVSTKTIWELLRNHQPVDQIIDKVPDEFYDWFTDQMRKLKREYACIDLICKIIISDLPDLTNAEECGILPMLAQRIQKHQYRSVIFAMWRGKPYEDIIWKMVKPKYEQPFKTEV